MSQTNNNFSSQADGLALCIDQHQAQRQLEYLGYKSKENVYLRFFYHSDDSRKHEDKGRKLNRLHWKNVEDYQQDGRGVYVVVNGAGGGHEDKDIKQCAAIFCEWDDRPVEEQLLHWETVGFLEPTFTIYSGDKSAQPYWGFDQPINVEQWRELQCLLIEVMSADPSNKNPSRVFRLAGGWHIKPGRDRVQTQIVQDSGKKYSYEQVRDELLNLHSLEQSAASVQPEMTAMPQPLVRSHKVDPVPQYQRYEDISIPISVSVPLYQCLSKQSRTLLEFGVSQPGRNTGGAKLVRDLIGTGSYLQSIGQGFDGDPRLLLEDYANRCTPPLSEKEVETIWKSGSKDNPSPSCKAEGVEVCIRSWYWNNYIKPRNQCGNSYSKHKSRGFGSGTDGMGEGGSTPIAALTLGDRIREILSRYESESLQVNALMDLASATGRTYNDISKLAKIIRAEGDLADEVIEAVKSFQGILTRCRKRLDIRRYIDQTLAHPLLAKAAAMPTAPEYLFNTLLATSASRIGTSARVIINPHGGYKQPCVFWTGNVNHSGQAKTPPQQLVVEPLEEMESAASQIHDIQLEDYEADKNSDRKPPVRQRRLLNNSTTPQKIRIHSENPRGLLEYIDELLSDYQRLNQHTKGKGDDLQMELGFWNGSGCNYDRHDARLFIARTGLSKTGTYQWDTLARLMADEVNFIASGYSARFLYCSILDAPCRYLDLLSSPENDTLKEKLYWLYGELERLPEADYLLSHEAKVLFQGWNHTLVNAEIEEQHFGLSLVYAKIESYTARIALWLHIVNAVLRGEKPLPVISGETMQHAIEIASFYLWQQKLIHAHNSPNRSLEGIFLKVQTQAEKFFTKCGKGVNASFLKTRINSLKGWVVEKIRNSIFKTLADAGHGRIEGEGVQMLYIPNTVPPYVPSEPPDFPCISTQNLEATSLKENASQLASDLEPLACVDTVGRVGAELIGSPSAESTVNIDLQAPVGEVGDCATSDLSSSLSGSALELDAQLQDLHQFTNSSFETTLPDQVQVVGGTTNSPPNPPTVSVASKLAATILQCTTWVAVVEAVEQNKERFRSAAKELAKEQRQNLSLLLAQHLCLHPDQINQLAWLPTQLITKALQRLSFTIERIANTNINDAHLVNISGCTFESVDRLGERGEIWKFTAPDGERFPLFGTRAIVAISLSANT